MVIHSSGRRTSSLAVLLLVSWAVLGGSSIPSSAAVSDFSILDVEVTQAVQCLDAGQGYTGCADNALGLSDYRATVVRVYLGHVGATCPGTDPYAPIKKNVTVKLRWLLSPPATLYTEVTQPFDVPCSTDLEKLRADDKGSANFYFPATDLGAKPDEIKSFDLEAEVVPPSGVPDVASNNVMAESVKLNPRPALDVAWVPIWYQPKANSIIPPPPNQYPAMADAGKAFDLMTKTYPMPVTYRWAGFVMKYTGTDVRIDDQGSSNELLIQLSYVRGNMKPIPDALIGWLPKGANQMSGVVGLGTNWGSTAWAILDKSTLQDQVSLAHEIGHTQGIDHVDELGCAYEINEAGFDVAKQSAYAGTTYDWMRDHAHDGWVSPYVWSRLLGKTITCPSGTDAAGASALGAPSAPETFVSGSPVPAIQVSGKITTGGPGTIDPPFVVSSEGPFPVASPTGAYCLDLEAPGGAVLSTHCFDLGFRELCGNHDAIPTDGFFFQLPLPVGAGRIVLRSGTTVLDTRAASANPPVVAITSPSGGEAWTGMQTIAWTAGDTDGDPLQHMVLYTADDGSTWRPLGVQLETTSLTVDADSLAGGAGARIRVVTTDGFHTTSADSSFFTVIDKPPVAFIASPGVNARFRPTDTVALSGGAQDLEDGQLAGSSLVWTSSVTGLLGTGAQLMIPGTTLAMGAHTITLTAIDGNGATDTVSTAIHLDATDVDGSCFPDNTAMLLRAGDPFRIIMKYSNGIPSDVAFTSYMETNDFFGPGHTLDTLTVPGPDIGALRSHLIDTTAFLPGEDEISVAIRSDATASAVLGSCAFMLTINTPPVADAGQDEVVECTGTAGTAVDLDGSRSFDMDGHPLSYTWTGPFSEGGGTTSGVAPTVTLDQGTHTVNLTVNDGLEDSVSDTVAPEVVDTTPPTGGITSPAEGACLAGPVTIQDDFSDLCSTTILRTYTPPPGPTYDAHGDYAITLEVQDDAGNETTDTVGFTIDGTDPGVLLLSPPSEAVFPAVVPFTILFDSGDADGAAGGVVHEIVKIDGCTVYDGDTYGDGDGLLSDETLWIDIGELCRIASECGFTGFARPVIRVEAEDCGGNVGYAQVRLSGGLRLRPNVCPGGGAKGKKR